MHCRRHKCLPAQGEVIITEKKEKAARMAAYGEGGPRAALVR